ncbi:uncharacterized protein SRS1_15212 [Sporisorium reilianum f. sp. reilianum]|uniref:Uncharacterized protein n=1 Tax=Sporisorium reilianum f. sp. reilianum TaxID=72559 RepID=A0A2N8UJ26_9BASI|nr:uncharacterized protein SRS1_15212 [Sporisorium reilianum f. sp. reilianum]
MHLVGESSSSGLQSSQKRASDPILDRDLHKRSPAPSPAPAPAPAPTAPPTRRNQHEPDHILIRADDFDQRLRQHGAQAAERERILGPFWARDMDQVMQIKRDVVQRGLGANPQSDASEHSKRQRRQTAAEETCFVGNEDLSCYPTAGTTIVQNNWSRFIWNANYPLFAQRGYVDVYLFQEDTDRLVTSWMSQDNGQNRLSFEPTDLWWANRSAANNIQPNQNISWPFYFVVLASGQPLTGTTSRLATFTAVQTTLPFSIAAARASSSSAAAASSASAASAASASAAASTVTSSPTGSAAAAASASAIQSSLSAALESSLHASGLSGSETLQGTTTATLPNGSVITATATAQANGGRLGGSANGGNSNGLALPTYAIVLISVLGFLAIVAAMAGAYFIMAALRRRRQRQYGDGSHRSSSPIMAAAASSLAGRSLTDGGHPGETSHMLEAENGGLVSAAGAGAAGAGAGAGAAMMASHSRSSRYSDEQPFTSDEASRMADAFRNALRNPEFAPGGAESSGADGDSPNENGGGSRASALLREELAAEGKDLRSVGDRKKPTWHQE